MKNRVTFIVITSKTGAQRRFSISKKLIYCIVILSILLLGSGIVGAWKYRVNVSLKKKSLLLEAEKGQLEAIARTVKDIKSEETAIRKLLGLEDIEEKKEAP
jgi:cell division protein FtsL